jgi:hypothetical protein
VKGTIPQAAEKLVREKHGDAVWDEVCIEAGLRRDSYFMPAADVDDRAVVRVVEAIGKVLRLSPQQVADAFGEYFVCEYAAELYPAYFRGATSARDLLLKVDTIHELVTRSVPNARPPRFSYSWSDENTLVIEYRSPRQLHAILVGLIKGVGAHYGEQLSVHGIGDRVTVRFPALVAA